MFTAHAAAAGEQSGGADRAGQPGARGVRQREDHSQQQLVALRTHFLSLTFTYVHSTLLLLD